MEIELDLLSLEFRKFRVAQAAANKRLTNSIAQFGQRVPVVVVNLDDPQQPEKSWLLIDGYLRYGALKTLNAETIHAETWKCDKQAALLQLLLNHQSRQWLPFEESLLLRELQNNKGLSQNKLAILVGKTQSWVSHRLALTCSLPESVQGSVLHGAISPWAASRILLPIARAIPQHAEKLQAHLQEHSHTTRELQQFYDHYQKCTKEKKDNITSDLDMFFKSQQLQQQTTQANKLKQGPDGEWKILLSKVTGLLKAAAKLVPLVFYSNQLPQEKESADKALSYVEHHFANLTQKVEEHSHDR